MPVQMQERGKLTSTSQEEDQQDICCHLIISSLHLFLLLSLYFFINKYPGLLVLPLPGTWDLWINFFDFIPFSLVFISLRPIWGSEQHSIGTQALEQCWLGSNDKYLTSLGSSSPIWVLGVMMIYLPYPVNTNEALRTTSHMASSEQITVIIIWCL